MTNIADRVSTCIDKFKALRKILSRQADETPDKNSQRNTSNISLPMLQKEQERLEDWNKKFVVYEEGEKSLDDRLENAPRIRDQVVGLLRNLEKSLQDTADILTGKLIPWDQDLSQVEMSDEDLDGEIDGSETTELSQIRRHIVGNIDYLFRLDLVRPRAT
ncbi:hypothetical protein BFJ66_g14426 [Fusarium oxysporum f. sp. cepae]|uniref:Prion-inhibition and propagation HeLo domain-containing protein n=1 Tax=Fusarium oxysporum f. sp. cepae TaxID=396571 RepID=A0A3L6N2L5_FUSOX|nr:hypothetical protein BFJ65_g14825 [Fusarium oxysporum f. sp. cepae]RKK31502.1 hypothetical protein BFJ67_g15204 [Fusarium oxysporum f. sp. cepae]RKK34429.1 hypothetical protein BFJ66_g14426 [Fusarium oxysporum f. sp. cepae]